MEEPGRRVSAMYLERVFATLPMFDRKETRAADDEDQAEDDRSEESVHEKRLPGLLKAATLNIDRLFIGKKVT